jgi:hypothetical protein
MLSKNERREDRWHDCWKRRGLLAGVNLRLGCVPANGECLPVAYGHLLCVTFFAIDLALEWSGVVHFCGADTLQWSGTSDSDTLIFWRLCYSWVRVSIFRIESRSYFTGFSYFPWSNRTTA